MMGDIIPLRRPAPLDPVLLGALAAYSGHTGADIAERQAEAFTILQNITDLRCTLASWETWVLDRIARGGSSYSRERNEEHDAAQAARKAAARLFAGGEL